MTLRDKLPSLTTNRTRIAELETRISQQRRLLSDVRQALRDQRGRLGRFRSKLDTLSERLENLTGTVKQLRVGYARVDSQMNAVELRLASLESTDEEPRDAADGQPEAVTASRVLDEIRQEHSRVRTRFQVMTNYEERIRRLEAALGPTADSE